MVAPLREYTLDSPKGNTAYYSHKWGFRQSPPYNLSTRYARDVVTRVLAVGEDRKAADINVRTKGFFIEDPQALSRAYDKLLNELSDRAALAVTLAELDQSVSMIQGRALQLWRFARALRRGNLVGAASELKLATVPKRASVKKSFANNYLEFHFGWAPLVSDIHSAVKVLQSPVKDKAIRVGASGAFQEYTFDHQVPYTNVFVPADNAWQTSLERSWITRSTTSLGCKMKVSNPNLWLANQLGLVNPLTVVNELIPFSFVADWFVNVSQFLSQGTDFYGLTLDNAYTTRVVKGRYVFSLKLVRADGTFIINRETQAVWSHMERYSGISKPTLFVRPFRIWGWRRAAAAVSLVIQQMKK